MFLIVPTGVVRRSPRRRFLRRRLAIPRDLTSDVATLQQHQQQQQFITFVSRAIGVDVVSVVEDQQMPKFQQCPPLHLNSHLARRTCFDDDIVATPSISTFN